MTVTSDSKTDRSKSKHVQMHCMVYWHTSHTNYITNQGAATAIDGFNTNFDGQWLQVPNPLPIHTGWDSSRDCMFCLGDVLSVEWQCYISLCVCNQHSEAYLLF